MDVVRGDSALVDNDAFQLRRVDDDLACPSKTEVHDALRGFLPPSVAQMVPRVVGGHDEWVPPQQRQQAVEPQMALLKMDDVRTERFQLSKHFVGHLALSAQLAQTRFSKWSEMDAGIQKAPMRLGKLARKQQQDIGKMRESAGQPDTVLTEVVRNDRDFHF
jgi:hypothetical protein